MTVFLFDPVCVLRGEDPGDTPWNIHQEQEHINNVSEYLHISRMDSSCLTTLYQWLLYD